MLRLTSQVYHRKTVSKKGKKGWQGGKDLASSALWTWSFCLAVLHAWENRGAADVNEHRTISDEPAESLADHSLDSPRIVGELVVIHDTDVDTEQGEQ